MKMFNSFFSLGGATFYLWFLGFLNFYILQVCINLSSGPLIMRLYPGLMPVGQTLSSSLGGFQLRGPSHPHEWAAILPLKFSRVTELLTKARRQRLATLQTACNRALAPPGHDPKLATKGESENLGGSGD